MLWFLDRNYDDCLFEVGENEVRRLINSNGNQTLISVTENDEHLKITPLFGDNWTSESLTDYVTKWFDLKRDLAPFYHLLEKSDLNLMPRDFFGLRILGIPDLFEALCWCIIGQQINLTFAYKLKRAFVERYGAFHDFEGKRYYHFPSPEDLLKISIDDLKEIQFSRQKADYVLGLAAYFHENKSFLIEMEKLDTKEQLSQLLKLRGVGEWTANYVMMKTLGKVDSIPHGDAGLFKALENYGVITDRKDRKKIDGFFNQFPGWGGYVTIYLWRSLTSPKLS